MDTVYIERDASGAIRGVYANRQPGYAEEALGADDAAVAAFRNPPAPKVHTVTPRQARLALLQSGLLDQVQTAVDAAGGATKITWEYATVFERSEPLITTLGSALGLTSTQIDQLFQLASTL